MVVNEVKASSSGCLNLRNLLFWYCGLQWSLNFKNVMSMLLEMA